MGVRLASGRAVARPYNLILFCILAFLLSGCRGIEPPVPTLALLPTITLTPTDQPTATPPTLAPTWTALPPTITPTLLPTLLTPNPQQQTAQAPIQIIDTGNQTKTITITEAQLNAAFERAYNLAPLERYSAVPHITLGDGSLIISSSIVPQSAPANGSAQTMTLIGDMQIFDGKLEYAPVDLQPQNVGVTTLQVKQAHRLLMRTINDLVYAVVPTSSYFLQAAIDLGTLTLTVSLK